MKNGNDDTIYQKSKNNIKGLQLNFESAGIEAYKKAAKQIKKDISEEINEAIF